MAEYPDAISYYVDRSRVFQNQNSHSAITIHGTGGVEYQTVESLGEWFRTNPYWVTSHFGIGRDGRIAQYVSLADGACADGSIEAGHDPFWDQFGGDNLNCHTISIEHVNDASNSLPITQAQQNASFKLVKWLCERYDIPPENIKSHASIAPQSRARCPGAYPWEQLRAFLKEGTMQQYGTGSADFSHWFVANDANHWKCKKNGAIVQYANLDFYKKLSVDGNTLPMPGLPLESEQYHTESDGYKWSSQQFERATMMFDPQHRKDSQPGAGGSYLSHVNPPRPSQADLDEANSNLSLANSRIADLENQTLASISAISDLEQQLAFFEADGHTQALQAIAQIIQNVDNSLS